MGIRWNISVAVASAPEQHFTITSIVRHLHIDWEGKQQLEVIQLIQRDCEWCKVTIWQFFISTDHNNLMITNPSSLERTRQSGAAAKIQNNHEKSNKKKEAVTPHLTILFNHGPTVVSQRLLWDIGGVEAEVRF